MTKSSDQRIRAQSGFSVGSISAECLGTLKLFCQRTGIADALELAPRRASEWRFGSNGIDPLNGKEIEFWDAEIQHATEHCFVMGKFEEALKPVGQRAGLIIKPLWSLIDGYFPARILWLMQVAKRLKLTDPGNVIEVISGTAELLFLGFLPYTLIVRVSL
jgi:hypothetical protein